LGIGALAYAVKTTKIPDPNEVSQAQATIFYYDDGVTELGRLGEANRVSVPIDQIPLQTQRTILSAEDRTFYQHGGFSVKGISRAILNNLKHSSTQGGSTITQQYAKNAYLTDERRFKRKAKELVLSIKLETQTSKDQILEDYLNTIYFGRGAYGIETAANQYFGKDVQDLSVEQSAVLAAIIQAPNGLAPETNLDGLQARWKYVLDGMVTQGWLEAGDRAAMEFPKIKKNAPNEVFGGWKGYLLEQARQEAYGMNITEDQINRAGLRITTTFNKQAQLAAVEAIKKEGPKTGTDGLRIGIAAVRPGTGEVVAIYGGADYLKNQVNNATQMIGQAGSTFKPFTLAAALENNLSLSSAFSGNNHTKVDNYDVVNYSNESWGKRITLLKATEHSVNSAFVQCAKKVGLQTVMDSAVRAGIPADTLGLEPNLAFTLGTASPHVVDIASAYSTFAARGLQVKPSYIKRITDSHDNELFKLNPLPVQAYSTKISDTVSYALQKVVQVGTGRPALALNRPAAGKTGTTNDNMSALFAGFTPELAAAVMLTKDGPDGQPTTLRGTGGMQTVYGASFPAHIWTEFMRGALEGTPITKLPTLPKGQPNGSRPSASASPRASQSPAASQSPTVTPTESAQPIPSDTGVDPSPSETAPTMVLVPDFSNLSFEAAIEAAAQAHLTLVVSNSPTDPDRTHWYVVTDSQTVAKNTEVAEGTAVTITVAITS
jgi:membrane peptidoglycan carboxypeptidase